MRRAIQEHLRRIFLSGLLLLVPLVLTYLLLKSLFLKMDGLAQPLVRRLWGISFPGLGILLSFLFLYGVGLVSTNLLGRALIRQGEKILLRIPLVKIIYLSFKEFLQILFQGAGGQFRGRVVLVEYPKKGFKTPAFLTRTFQKSDGTKRCVVLVPTVPNPTTGFLAIFPEEEVRETEISIEEATKLFLSAGILEVGKESL